MSKLSRFSGLVLLISLFILPAFSCKKAGETGQKNTVATPAQPGITQPQSFPATDNSGILARINGEPITDAEVTERVKNNLRRLESQVFDIKNDGLWDLIEEKLLSKEAEKRKVSVDELLKSEVEGKVEEPTEQEIESFYSMFKKRFNDQPLDKVRGQLVTQIKGTKKGSLYAKFIDQIKKDAKIEVLLERPRIEVSVDDDPSQGGKPNAPIVLIEFSDFQCPFCKKTRPTITKIMETYKNKVHYVFRDFPLSFHKQAEKAAEAANCAGDQNKYWPYNTLLWEKQGNLQPDQLREYAKELGLNEKKFNECLDSGKFAQEIEKDQQEGMQVGVSGTPAYFINGIFVSGAQPFEKFQEIIDSELMTKK